ncbi:MAG: RecB family exonuclease [Acidimicrobiia bacterium]
MEDVLALSPSRVADFKVCAQLFKFRVLDGLPQEADPASARGTLVHAVLEQIFLLDAQDRTQERAIFMLHDIWKDLKKAEEVAGLELTEEEETAWLEQATGLIRNYFRLEDPARVEPHEVEVWVEHATETLLLRGIVDRIEVRSDGEWVLTDYKTGRTPSVARTLGSFFGLKFYALLCWRAFGRMPRELRLVHLKEPAVLQLVPTEAMLKAMERQLSAVATALRRALSTGDWRARPGVHCSWCSYRDRCPAWSELGSVLGPN